MYIDFIPIRSIVRIYMPKFSMGSHMDPELVDKIVHEVKSQGVFDEFRKDSMADVDTKPAYQNLRQRVECTVKKFLSEQHWTPDMNKNQLRERLRKHITESGFLDVGVERIVDQVVNPKIGSVFQPRIEEITYKYLGLPPPPVKHEPPPPIMHPLPPLPLTGPPLKIETSSLLPTGLEQVSPDSDKATVKSESRADDPSVMDMDIDIEERMPDDDDESPPFEPLVKCVDITNTIKIDGDIRIESVSEVKEEKFMPSDKPDSIIIDQKAKVNAVSTKADLDSQYTLVARNAIGPEMLKEVKDSFELEAVTLQESQLSQVSSDSHISDVTANASHSFMDNSSVANPAQILSEKTETAMELASANISEEAQMPKFNENSNDMCEKSTISELHFDIKKDEIKFQGTERKSTLLEEEGECSSATGDINSGQMKLCPSYHFGNLTIETEAIPIQAMAPITPLATPTPNTPVTTPTPTPHDSSFGSSLEDTSNQHCSERCEDGLANYSATHTDTALTATMQVQTQQHEAACMQVHKSSTRSRKHSKDKRHSHELKEKHKDKDREKERDKHKDRDRGKDKDRNGHKERNMGRRGNDRNKDRERARLQDKRSKSKTDHSGIITERSSSSKRSNSSTRRSYDTSSNKIEKNMSSKQSSTFTSSSSSSSRSESHEARREKHQVEKQNRRISNNNLHKDNRKSEIAKGGQAIDDHCNEKEKPRRRKSTDSNDEDKGSGGTRTIDRGSYQKNYLNCVGAAGDIQQTQSKEQTNSSPGGSHSSKTKSKNVLEEEDQQSDHIDMLSELPVNFCTTDVFAQTHRSKVVILNDILENPNVNYIELRSKAPTPVNNSQSAQHDKRELLQSSISNQTSPFEAHDELFFFEEMNAQFSHRLRLLDNAMNGCRRVVNNLRFDCASEMCDAFEPLDERVAISGLNDNMQTQTCATLTIDCVTAYTDRECLINSKKCEISPVGYEYNIYGMQGKRKDNNDCHPIRSKPSPTPSDASGNSKENVALHKNAGDLKRDRRTILASKLNQQRYNSEDLYKPRPILSQRSRRRGMDSII